MLHYIYSYHPLRYMITHFPNPLFTSSFCKSTTSYSVLPCAFFLVRNLYFSSDSTKVCIACLFTCIFAVNGNLAEYGCCGHPLHAWCLRVPAFGNIPADSPPPDPSCGAFRCAGSVRLSLRLRTSIDIPPFSNAYACAYIPS